MLGEHGLAWPWESLHVEALAWFDHWLKGRTPAFSTARLPIRPSGRRRLAATDTWPVPAACIVARACADGALAEDEGKSGARTSWCWVPG